MAALGAGLVLADGAADGLAPNTVYGRSTHGKNNMVAGRNIQFWVPDFLDNKHRIRAGAIPTAGVFQPLPGSRHFKLNKA